MRIDEAICSFSAMLGRGSTACTIAFLTLSCIVSMEPRVYAQSVPEVELHARGGSVAIVSLLHVDEVGVLVDRFCGDWSTSVEYNHDRVMYLRCSQVDSIVMPSEYETVPYALAFVKGFLWGAAATIVGGLIGEQACGNGREDRDCIMRTGLTIGTAGFVAGTIYNWPDAEEHADTIYHPSNDNDREMLRKLCVYPDTLPAPLRDLLPKRDEK